MKIRKIISSCIICLLFTLGLTFAFQTYRDVENVNAFTYEYDLAVDAITSGQVIDNGGQIYLASNSTFTVAKGTISNGIAVNGGAIYVSTGAKFVMNGGVIEGNTAVKGGAIYVEEGGTLELNAGTIRNNVSQYGYREDKYTPFNYAIYAENPDDVTISDEVVFENNTFAKFVDSDIDVYVDDVLSACVDVEDGVTSYIIDEIDMPLNYEECCGYYLDAELTDSAYGKEISIIEGSTIDLYTKTATISKLEFAENSVAATLTASETGTTYNVRAKSAEETVDEVVIPLMYNGGVVTNIATATTSTDGAFYNCVGMTDVYLPVSITDLGDYSFYNCDGLTGLVIPENVVGIGDYTIYSCGELVNVVFPINLESIGNMAFNSCSKLEISTFPSTLKTIGTSAFSGCNGITTMTIPSGVQSIGTSAFRFCANLTEITIPTSVTTLGRGVLNYCNKLNTLTIPFVGETTTTNTFIGWIFGAAEYTSNSSQVPSSLKKITVSGTANIGEGAFYACTSVTNIYVNRNITTIGANAFMGCTNLLGISLPTKLTSLGSKAFYDCVKITTITLPATLTEVSSELMANCTALKSVGGVNITNIQNGAFKDCINLKAIQFLTQLKTIGSEAFSGCNTLSGALSLGVVSTIGDSAFSGCLGFTEVAVGENLTSIGSGAFNGCTNISKLTIPYVGQTSTSNTFLGYIFGASTYEENATYVPEVLTTLAITGATGKAYAIAANAMNGCTSLTDVAIDAKITGIGASALAGCAALASLSVPFVGASTSSTNGYLGYIFGGTSYSNNATIVPETLKTLSITGATGIYSYACYGCSNLTSVTIGENVTSLGTQAFAGCTGIENLYFNATSMSDLTYNRNAFYQMGDNATDGTAVTFGSEVTKVPAYLFYPGDENITATEVFATSTKTNNITKVEFLNNNVCASIGVAAFFYTPNLKDIINIPNSIETIGHHAFTSCGELQSITIPESLKSIGNFAFFACDKVTEINFNAINMNDFAGDSSEGYVFGTVGTDALGVTLNIGENVERIPAYIFESDMTTADRTDIVNVNFLGNKCVEIGDYAFHGCEMINSINLPESLETIGEFAFYGCSALEDLKLYQNLTTIGSSAFASCSGLQNIEYYAANIGDFTVSPFASSGGDNLRVYIGNAVARIPNYLFYNGNTSELEFEDDSTCTEIGTYAFSYNNIVELSLPNSVIKVGDYAFYSSNIVELSIPDSVTTIGGHAFQNNDMVDLVVGHGVQTIGSSAFEGCQSLNSITLPESVTKFERYAFNNCLNVTELYFNCIQSNFWYVVSQTGSSTTSELTYNYVFGELGNNATGVSVVFGKNVQAVPNGIFMCYSEYASNNVKTVTFEEGAICTSITYAAFWGCDKLESVTFPNNLTTIESSAFQNCSALNNITIPNTITTIGSGAFGNCSSIESLVIPGSVQTIESTTFYHCTGMETLELEEGVQTISDRAFEGCSGLLSLAIPASVTSLVAGAFGGCNNLEEIVVDSNNTIYEDGGANAIIETATKTLLIASNSTSTIPSDVLIIGDSAFSSRTKLTSVTIPNGVTTINSYAFYGCNSLVSVYIPTTVVTISASGYFGPFKGCGSDFLIFCGASSAPSGWNSYWNNYSYSGEYSTYYGYTRAAAAREFSNMQAFASANPDFEFVGYDLVGYVGNDTKIVIPDGTLRVGSSVFKDNTTITSVTIPDSVEYIGESAFYNCTSLTSIEIPDSVTSVGDDAFYGCSFLRSVSLGGGITELSDNMFYGCSKLEAIDIPDSVTGIGSKAFYGCTLLSNVRIGDKVKYIYGNAFAYCTSLESIFIPYSVKNITAPSYSSAPFYGCSSSLIIYTELNGIYIGWGDYWDYCDDGVVLTSYKNISREDYEAGTVSTSFITTNVADLNKDGDNYPIGQVILTSKDELEYDISNFRIA